MNIEKKELTEANITALLEIVQDKTASQKQRLHASELLLSWAQIWDECKWTC